MASETGGVKPFSIAGRMVRERERLVGMTDEERAWRKQWLKDQELTAREPVMPKDFYKERYNPIRRLYRAPLNALQVALTGSLGAERAFRVRFWTGKFLLAAAGIYATAYYFKYNDNDWTRKGGWRVLKSRVAVNPGDEGYPKVSDRTKPSDYGTRGFEKATI
ncbi:uncharacterized protein LOC123295485 [Chrysoperla carnea]|uniref:uncharacterized protein LOC123295485 n=1 Tax=Chrysoperla carnea TaxID=189513 RepID=UPI001D061FE5|nr:uncharacterized protein LOC123295485 [Chrysoperla carnea]